MAAGRFARGERDFLPAIKGCSDIGREDTAALAAGGDVLEPERARYVAFSPHHRFDNEPVKPAHGVPEAAELGRPPPRHARVPVPQRAAHCPARELGHDYLEPRTVSVLDIQEDTGCSTYDDDVYHTVATACSIACSCSTYDDHVYHPVATACSRYDSRAPLTRGMRQLSPAQRPTI